jgi:tetratricopeptide (TPR) repeat protein
MKLIFVLIALILTNCTKKPTPEGANSAKDPVKLALDLAASQPNFNTEISAGLELSKAGRYSEALEQYQKAKVRSPDSPIANNNICHAYASMKVWVTAIEHCKLALQSSPDFQLAKNNLAWAESSLQSELAKLQQLETEEKKLPAKEKRSAQLNRGLAYSNLGDYPTAIKVWKEIKIENDSTSVLALNNLGTAYIMEKNFTEARKVLNEALAKDPNNQLVKNNIVWLEKASAGN